MKWFLKTTALVGVLATLAMSISGCERIDTGNTGVEVSMSGSVSPTTLSQGLYLTLMRTIYEVSGKEDTIQLEDMHPKSKDNLTMEDLDIDITIQIDPAKAALIYTRFSNDLHWNKGVSAYVVGTNYVTRQARAVIYRVVANHDALTMHQQRQKLEEEITKDLQKELDHDMGKDWVAVKNVNIRNLVTDKNVEASIREIASIQFQTRQMIEGQNKSREQAIRDKIDAEGKANAKAAEAKIAAQTEAENMKTLADGNALKMAIEAKALANANEIIAKSLTPEILKNRELEILAEIAKKGGAATIVIPSGTTVTPMINTGNK